MFMYVIEAKISKDCLQRPLTIFNAYQTKLTVFALLLEALSLVKTSIFNHNKGFKSSFIVAKIPVFLIKFLFFQANWKTTHFYNCEVGEEEE